MPDPAAVTTSSLSSIASSNTPFEKPQFEQLYLTYRPQIQRYFLQNGLKHHDAQDLTGDVFVNAFRNYDDFRSNCPAYAWLISIARNRLIDESRRRKWRKTIALDEIYEPASSERTPRGIADLLDVDSEFARLLTFLTPKQRIALQGRYHEQSHDEIAGGLHTNIDASKSLVRNARFAMIKLIESGIISIDIRPESYAVRTGLKPRDI